MDETLLLNSAEPEIFFTPEDKDTPVWYRIYNDVYIGADAAEDTYLKYKQLKEEWVNETIFASDPEAIYNNINYRKIICLGTPVVPLLLRDLRRSNIDWLFALRQILNIDPISSDHNGHFDLMKDDWLNWARKNIGYNYGSNDLRYSYHANSELPEAV
jgi:hypothetical protein